MRLLGRKLFHGEIGHQSTLDVATFVGTYRSLLSDWEVVGRAQ